MKSLLKVDVKQDILDYYSWHQLDSKLNDNTRKSAILAIEGIVAYLTSQEYSQKIDKIKKKEQKSIKKFIKKKQFHKIKDFKNKNKSQMDLSNRSLRQFGLEISKNKDLYSFLLPKLKMKHISSLWHELNERIVGKTNGIHDGNCSVCQYGIHDSSTPITLECCGIKIHFNCLKDVVKSKKMEPGLKVSIEFLGCIICRKPMQHSDNYVQQMLLEPMEKIQNVLHLKIEKRLKFDGLWGKKFQNNVNPIDYGMKRYSYFICYKCNEPYYNGLNVCHANDEDNMVNPKNMLCTKCSPVEGFETNCKKHGTEFIQYKCMFCCSIATWDCGRSHFCELCHRKAGELWRIQSAKEKPLLQCPCVSDPKTNLPKKVDLDHCPLQIKHPPNGQEYCLGCAKCKQEES